MGKKYTNSAKLSKLNPMQRPTIPPNAAKTNKIYSYGLSYIYIFYFYYSNIIISKILPIASTVPKFSSLRYLRI